MDINLYPHCISFKQRGQLLDCQKIRQKYSHQTSWPCQHAKNRSHLCPRGRQGPAHHAFFSGLDKRLYLLRRRPYRHEVFHLLHHQLPGSSTLDYSHFSILRSSTSRNSLLLGAGPRRNIFYHPPYLLFPPSQILQRQDLPHNLGYFFLPHSSVNLLSSNPEIPYAIGSQIGIPPTNGAA